MPRLALTLLGSFQVLLDGEPATEFESDKVRALLAYLAVESHRPHRRERLAGLLWPERPERSARQNLSQALYNLRRAIADRDAAPPFLLVTHHTLQFNPSSDHRLDTATFTHLLAACDEHHHSRLAACNGCMERLQQAVGLCQGDFLEGFSLGDSAAFEEWSVVTRERLHRLVMATHHRLADCHEQRGEYEPALQHAWRQVELDPWHEEAHQQIMRLLALSDRRSEALAHYETCRRLLAEELGADPGAETTRLHEQIRDGFLSRGAGEQGSRGAREQGSRGAGGQRSRGAREQRSRGEGDVTASPTLAAVPVALPPFLSSAPPRPSTPAPFVARQREIARLNGFLEGALAGDGQVVFVTGGAGRGKTALIQEFSRRAQETHPDLIVAGGHCNAHTGIGDPYLPFREALGLLTGDVEARWAAGAISHEHARRLWKTLPLTAAALVEQGPDLIDTFVRGAALLARVVACSPEGGVWLERLRELVERETAGAEAPTLQQSDLFEQYTRVLQTLACQAPLLLVLDDLQWADLGSISLLFHLGRRLTGSRALILGAYRPEEVAAGRGAERHPLEPVVNEFQRELGEIVVDLSQAKDREFVDALLDSEPNRLGADFRETLLGQTGGHPLFTVELLRGMQERGDLVQGEAGRWVEGPTLDWEILPARVEAAIAERIGRLPEALQEALAIASVEGEEFTAEVVAGVQAVDEAQMVRWLSGELEKRHRLVGAQRVLRVDGQRLSRYRFRHYLFQKYLENSLDEVERAHLHERVGNLLETLYGEQAAEVAVGLARHFETAGLVGKAIHYRHLAGSNSVRLSANQEAIMHFRRGLALLDTLPNTPERARQELTLQLALGVPLTATRGWGDAEVGRTYARAREICRQVGKDRQLFPALLGLWRFNVLRAQFQTGRELAEQILTTAQRVDDPALLVLARRALGTTLWYLGEFAPARAHLEQCVALYDSQQHRSLAFLYDVVDQGVASQSFAASGLWNLGYPEQALDRSHEALALAHELAHPFSLGWALGFATMVRQFRREGQAAQELAEATIALATEEGFAVWSAWGAVVRGWALAAQGEAEEGLREIRRGMAASRATGTVQWQPLLLTFLAEAHATTGQAEEGLRALAEALALIRETGARYCEAEVYRLKGELLLMRGASEAEPFGPAQDEAEGCFQQAIEVARRQQARSLELRATMSLCRLLQGQGKREEAHQVLAEIYDWFTEGFDTRDLEEARVLLNELAGGRAIAVA